MKTSGLAAWVLLTAWAAAAIAGSIPIGAAPKGDATVVATRIIKYNFPEC